MGEWWVGKIASVISCLDEWKVYMVRSADGAVKRSAMPISVAVPQV
jgi:hypothetical protein